MYNIKIKKRDFLILQAIYRFRFALSRHIRFLADFKSQRTTDRRLKLLLEDKLIARQKLLYGVPYIYTVTKKGKRLICATPIDENIRVDKIKHDILVLDCLFKLQEKYDFNIKDITTERELHSKDSFSEWKHHPDFIFKSIHEELYAVEIELTPKSKERLEKNVQSNFSNYDFQIWVVPSNQSIIIKSLSFYKEVYTNMIIIILEDLLQ